MTLPASSALWFLLAAAAAPGGDAQPPDKGIREELQRLQGSWQIEMLEEDGEKLSADDLKGRSILFGKDAFFLRRNNAVVQIGLLKLDPTKSPKTANAIILQGDHKGDIMLGIYELQGDNLKICFDKEGQERPKEFKTAPKCGQMLIVLKRVRAKAGEQDLTGSYRSETVEIDGSKHASDVTIDRVGDCYLVTYKRNKAIGFIGIAIRKGDIFSMAWLSQGQVGVSVYQIEKDKLVGQFTMLGGAGTLGLETLTRVDPAEKWSVRAEERPQAPSARRPELHRR
jgi:uncharacterized protein (TIGR03067 family)